MHEFCATNTWRHDTGPTCRTAKGDMSRIDFIFTRLRQTDRVALESMPIESFDLLGPAKIGHRPIVGSINLSWRPASGTALQCITYQSRINCRQTQQDDARWMHFVESNSTLLTQARLIDSHDIQHTQELLTRNFQQHFATRQVQNPLWTQTHGLMSQKWDLLHRLRMIRTVSVRNCVVAWRLMVEHQRCHALQKHKSRQARTERFDRMLDEAREAANRHDMLGLFAIVRKLSPKETHSKINLRGATGELLSPIEAFAHLQQFVRTSWDGPPLHSPVGLAPGVPFSEQEVAEAFARLNAMKSTAPGTCPNACLKASPLEAASQLYPLLKLWCSQTPPYIPQTWKDGSLFLLPKPCKKPDTAAHLRPLALQDPLGTTILGIITGIARTSVLPSLCAQPQFAYLPQRGTFEAISRAVHHCRSVRDTLYRFRRSHAAVAHNQQAPEVFGGLTISIDLKRAFDSLPRTKLFHDLRDLGVAEACTCLLQEWHVGTRYRVEHKGHCNHVDVHLGVRQGCRAAPFLWACSMSRLMTKLAQLTSVEWVLRVLTFYADDFLLQCEIHSEQDLWNHLQFIGVLFDLLDQAGLLMNISKTVALFHLSGKRFRKLHSRVLMEHDRQWFLLIPRASGKATKIQLVADIKYLGVKLCYSNFERLTLEYRLAAGRQANRRLHRWLYGKKGLDKVQRRKLWECVVRTTLLYGIWATGASTAGLKQLLTTMVTMQRMLYMNHSHRTRETHEQFFQDRQLEQPHLFLHRCCLRLLEKHTRKLELLPQNDILQHLQLHGTASLLAGLDTLIAGGPSSLRAPTAFQCSICGGCFNNIRALLAHEGSEHGLKHGRIQVFNTARDATDGVPICRHCNRSFPTWRALSNHIEFASCPLFDPHQVMTLKQQDIRACLVPQILHSDPGDLPLDRSHEDYLRSHCSVCGKHQLRFQDMSHHLALEHGALATTTTGLYQHWRGSMRSPCGFCQTSYSDTHNCKVLFQLMVLRAQCQLAAEHPGQPEDEPMTQSSHMDGGPGAGQPSNTSQSSYRLLDAPLPHVCIICADFLPSAEQLQVHMRDHDSYHSVRDATMGHPTCAHCKTRFRETWELQRHISRHSCPVFDATLQPTGAQCHDPDIQEAVRAGQLIELLLNPQHPEVRLRFTLSCCMCGLGQSRVADLTRHLQTQHGPFYRAADDYVALIEEQHLDCVCNPRRPAQPRAHRCIAWRQLAMIEFFINSDRRQFYPTWSITDDSLVKLALVNPRLHAQAPKLIQDLRDNIPLLLLNDAVTCEGLGHHCALCNRSFPDPPDLVQHIEQHHATECQQCNALLQCLGKHLLAHIRDPLPCHACNADCTTYNVVDQTIWYALRHKCVVLLNLALVYLQTRPDFESHGRAQAGGVRRGQDVAAAGNILRYARRRTDSQPTNSLGQEDQSQPSGALQRSLLDDSSSRRIDAIGTGLPAMSDAGYLDSPSRGCPQCPGLSGPMHPVSHTRGSGSDTPPHPGSPGLARVVLMQTLLEELMRRYKGFCTKLSDQDFRRQSILTKIILEDNTIPYLQWCHQQKCMIPTQTQGISTAEMEQKLQRLHTALQEPANLVRFFALKSQGNTTGIQLSMRNDPLMCEMRSLIGSAVWMLVAGRLKAHSQQRSKVAQEMQAFAYPRRQNNRRH